MEKIKQRKILALILILAIAIVSGAGYWYWNSFFAKKPLNIVYGYLPIADSAVLFAAAENGFFKEEGLNLTLVAFRSGPHVIEALAAGSIQMGLSGIVPALNAYASGIDIRMATDGSHYDREHRCWGIVVRKDSGIKSIPDLKGKTFLLHSYGTVEDLAGMPVLFERYNMSWPKDVNVVLVPWPQMPGVMLAGQADSAHMGPPYVTILLETGDFEVIWTYTEVFPDGEFPSTTTVFLKKFADEHPDAVNAFIRAYTKAVRWVNTHIEETKKIIANYTKIDYELVEKMDIPTWSEELDPKDIQRLIDVMLKYGGLKKEISVDEVIFKP